VIIGGGFSELFDDDFGGVGGFPARSPSETGTESPEIVVEEF